MALGARARHRGQPDHQPAAARADHRRGRPGGGQPARGRAVGVRVQVLPVGGAGRRAVPGGVPGAVRRRRHRARAPLAAGDPAAGQLRRHPPARPGLGRVRPRRPVRRAAAGRDADLRRRRERAGQPEADAQGRARAPCTRWAPRSSSRCRSRRSWSRACCGCAGRGGCAAAGSAGCGRCAGSPCRCWTTRSTGRWRWPRRWTPAGTAGAPARPGRSGWPPARCSSPACSASASACTACSTAPAPAGSGCRCCCSALLVAGFGLPLAGRRVRRSVYRPDPWRLAERLVAGERPAAGGGAGAHRPGRPRQPLPVAGPARLAAGCRSAPRWPCSSRCCRPGWHRRRSSVAQPGPGGDGVIGFERGDRHLRRTPRRRCCGTSSLTVDEGELCLVVGRTGVGQVHPARRDQRAGAALHRRPAGRPGHGRRPATPGPPAPRAGRPGRRGRPGPAGRLRHRHGRGRAGLRHGAAGGARRPRCASGSRRPSTCSASPSCAAVHFGHSRAASSSGSRSGRCSPRTRGVLVLDEPTSALDPTAAEEVLAAITRLVHDLGITVVVAEHRLERVVQYADRLVLLTGSGGRRLRAAGRRAGWTRRSRRRSSSSAGSPAGRRCRCRSATPAAGPRRCASVLAGRRPGDAAGRGARRDRADRPRRRGPVRRGARGPRGRPRPVRAARWSR